MFCGENIWNFILYKGKERLPNFLKLVKEKLLEMREGAKKKVHSGEHGHETGSETRPHFI